MLINRFMKLLDQVREFYDPPTSKKGVGAYIVLLSTRCFFFLEKWKYSQKSSVNKKREANCIRTLILTNKKEKQKDAKCWHSKSQHENLLLIVRGLIG